MKKCSMTLVLASLAALLAPTPVARADIFQWEYINPADPALGKQQSTMLAPGGAGANATPGTNLSNRNLTKAYLTGADLSWYIVYGGDGYPTKYHFANLTNANLSEADLTNALVGGATLINANLSQADLTDANFSGYSDSSAYSSPTSADLTGANLTGAEVRGANFGRNGGGGITLLQLYSTASYQAQDLSGIGLSGHNLTDANLSYQNLTNSSFHGATLTGASLSGAEVGGANFSRYWDPYSSADITGGITPAQLYSTVSYQTHDLGAIGLGLNEFAGANFAGQNLAGASFRGITHADESGGYSIPGTNLTGADLSGADARGADFFAAQLAGANLSQANLQNASFAGDAFYDAYTNLANANLSGADARAANFSFATLSGANFTDAEVQGAEFASSGITAAQIYSTASYRDHDLRGTRLAGVDLTGANLAGQNLSSAIFIYGRLGGANLSQANITNANFSVFNDVIPDLTGANLRGVDARGSNLQDAILAGANTSDLIQSDGHIAGLDLTAGESLLVRDYDGNTGYLWYPYTPTGPLPIVVDQHLAMNATSTLRLAFDADAWDSTISFAPGIPIVRGGTLDLTFASDVDIAAQSGRTIDLFDWTGVSPTGAFTVSSPYSWDLTTLYTTGEITLLPTTDYNGDGHVDGADFAAWSNSFGLPTGAANNQGDADYDHDVDGADFLAWQRQFGSGGDAVSNTAVVPEPSTLLLSIVAVAGIRRRSGGLHTR